MKPQLILVLIASTALYAGCGDSSTSVTDFADSQFVSTGGDEPDEQRSRVVDFGLRDLSEEEIEGLVFMREEEKLARDVYLHFENLYDLNVFGNIASSEQSHTDAVLVLLDRYGIDDPVVDDTPGVFQNEVLQALYDDLIVLGSQSQIDALFVGCAIEEIDILDLVEYIDGTNRADIVLVYERLLAGSGNHLRSYVGLWEQQTGQVYEPRYLTVEDYEEIINASGSGGGQGGQGGQGGSGNGGGNGNGGR